MSRAIDRSAFPVTLVLMQQDWKEVELDYVVGRWFLRGEASPEQAKEMMLKAERRYPALQAKLAEKRGRFNVE